MKNYFLCSCFYAYDSPVLDYPPASLHPLENAIESPSHKEI